MSVCQPRASQAPKGSAEQRRPTPAPLGQSPRRAKAPGEGACGMGAGSPLGQSGRAGRGGPSEKGAFSSRFPGQAGGCKHLPTPKTKEGLHRVPGKIREGGAGFFLILPRDRRDGVSPNPAAGLLLVPEGKVARMAHSAGDAVSTRSQSRSRLWSSAPFPDRRVGARPCMCCSEPDSCSCSNPSPTASSF